MTSSAGREIVSGKVVVDAPGAPRRTGAAVAACGVLALPTALSLLEPRTFGGDALAMSGALMLATAVLYFGGLGAAAAAGSPLGSSEEACEGRLYQSDGHLFVHTAAGSWTLPRRALKSAFYDREQGRVVFFGEDDLRIAVWVRDESDATRAIRALGLDQRAPELALTREGRPSRVLEGAAAGVAGLFVGLLFMLIAVIAMDSKLSPPFGAGSMLALLGCAFVPIFATIRYVARLGAPLSIVLGTDGALARTRPDAVYLRYDAIDAIEPCDRGVIVKKRDGSDVFFHTIEPELLAAALSERMADEPPSSSRLAGLERAGASLPAWRDRLATLVDAGDRYRLAPLCDDLLAAVVEDPHAEADHRVAAAFVLSRREQGAHVGRIRVAANSSAHPGLRAALHAAADGELEEVAIGEATTRRASPHPSFGRALGPRSDEGRPSAP